MKAKELRQLPWVKVEDWSELVASQYHKDNEDNEKWWVCEKDIDIFVENIIREMARELNMPYRRLKSIIKSENKSFYSLKKRIFSHYMYEKEEEPLVELENTFRVPYIGDSQLKKCQKLYEALPKKEQLEFFVNQLIILKNVIDLKIEEIEREK